LVSHKLHIKWATSLGVPEEIARLVNKVIDERNWHDLGRLKSAYTLSIIPLRGGCYVKPRLTRKPTIGKLARIMREEFKDKESLYYAVVAAILHHFMDFIMKVLRRYGSISLEYPKVVLKKAERLIHEHQVSRLEILCMTPGAFKEVKEFIYAHVEDMLKDILHELETKGKVPRIGPDTFSKVFCEWAKHKNMHVITRIESISESYNHLLPPSAAARKIYSELRKGRYTHFYMAGTEFAFRDVDEAMHSMLKELKTSLGDIMYR